MSDEWSRRSVLKSSLGVPLAGVALNYITEDVTAADGDSTLPDNEYAALRERWADLLTGGSIDETKPEYDGVLAKLDRDAQNYQDTMEADPTDRLWSALPIPSDSSSSYDEGHLTDSYGRLLTMAKAYQTEGCALKGDSSIASDIVTGLEFLYNRLYNEDQSQFGNWWHWEIGAPMRLMGICTLLSADLTSIQLTNYTDAVETHVGSPYEYTFYDHTSGGSNRVDESVITALRGILTETDSTIKLARDCVEDSDIFQYTTASSGNGLYPDGSYVYHKEIPYIGSYGAVLFTGLSELFTILDGSSWEITGVDRDVIYDAVDDAISPFMFKGLMMGSVSGRAISREDQSDHVRGHAVTGTVLQMANTASEPYATEFEELAKGWIENDTWDSFMSDAEVADIANAEAVLEDDSITAASEPIQSQVFHNMDRAVHNRSDWAFVISMCSERIARYQAINEENLQGWYTGAGMTQLYDDDLGHYTDGYWPTVDPYRLPGTTVDTSERTDLSGTHHPLPPTQWVGGATVDEEFSMVGMEFEAEKAPLTGKKSWLALDDMIVGLGSDITLVEENRIEDNPPGENPDATQIPSTADTFVRDGDSSGDNYSSWGLMVTKNDVEGYNRESFLKFDLSSLSESVEEAKLHLHGRVKTDEGATSGDVSISEVTDDSWSGGELTWDTKPGIESEIGTMTLTGTKQWYEIDVTEFIKSQASGDGTASFAIQQLGNLRSEFDSPDGGSNAPQLSIVTSGDGETSDGETPSEENSDATDIQSAAGTFVRDGDSSGDSYGWGVIVVKNDDVGYNRESFVKFDLSSLSGSVEQATLRLYGQVNTDGDVTSSEVSVSEVTDDSWTGSELTWDTKPEIGSEIGTMTVGETEQWYTIDVTAFAKSQASGDGTASLAIQQISGPRTEFDSPTGGDNPPQLSVVTSGDSTTSTPTIETTTHTQSIDLSWDEMSGTVAEYDVYLDGASQPTQTVTGLSTTVSDLDPATTYDVSVIAVRSDEESTVATTTVTTDALSMFEAIDTNGNGEIDDTELLEASDHWRTGTPVDSAGGETVDDLDLLEMADQWRNS